MEQNLFEEFQAKKEKLLLIADKAAQFGWIPKTRNSNDTKKSISLEEIKEKIDKDTLTIGVIGQMKCGKSTFLNSFVFNDIVLPAATTPMTAALTIMTYGESKRIVAEFYTKDEWAEQQMQAKRSTEEAENSLDESKIKAAKELVSKAGKLGNSIENYLGKTIEDSFEHLIEYVGADGKYVSITKSVNIYYPHEFLKGVEIVDTPGFNDPIVSREERTKDFLKRADVVIMMLYAGRPFDATDRDIIFKNVGQCGIGKVLVGINKYDIPFENGEDETQIKEYVLSEIRKACQECNDNTLVEILRDTEPIPLSAEMALLSKIPMSKIAATESLEFAFKRHSENFGISSQKEMYSYSHMDDFVKAVKHLIDNEKSQVLFAKPLNAILAAGNSVKSENEKDLQMINSKIQLLSMPNDDIDEVENNLARANKRISKKIDSLGDSIEYEIQNLVRQGKNELEDIVDQSCRRMKDIIHNEWKRFKSFKSIEPKLDAEKQKLATRKLKRATDELAGKGKRLVKKEVNEFFSDAEDLLMRYIPDFDSRDFIKSTEKEIQMEVDSTDLFKVDSSKEEDYGAGDFIYDILNGASWGALGIVSNLLSHDDNVAEVEKKINNISNNFNPLLYLECAFQSKDTTIEKVKSKFITNLIEPLQEQIQEIRGKKQEKEKELQTSVAKREELEKQKKIIAEQLSNIEMAVNVIK